MSEDRRADGKSNSQLFALAFQNGLFMLVVWLVCTYNYSTGIHIPGDFVIAEIVIVLLSLIALTTKDGAGLWSDSLGSLIRIPSALRLPRWKPGMVVVLTSANVVPFALLVNETGGVTVSPFTPLLTVPALFTAFQAQKPRSILVCVALGMAAFSVTTIEGPDVSPASLPRPGAILFVSLIVMFLAGVLSAGAKARENNLTVSSVLAGAAVPSVESTGAAEHGGVTGEPPDPATP